MFNKNKNDDDFFKYYDSLQKQLILASHKENSEENEKSEKKQFFNKKTLFKRFSIRKFLSKNKLFLHLEIASKISMINRYLNAPPYLKKLYEWRYSFSFHNNDNGFEYT